MDKNSGSSIMRKTPSELIGQLNDIENKYAPSFLFIVGDSGLFNIHPRVSIIGTRNPTEIGRENASRLTKFLVDKEIIVVSGLAKGIDTIAHKTAIENGGSTIAVLGTPLDMYYPNENKELQDKIMKEHLVVSQFSSGAPIQRKNFPMRNRTMALLSHASIIVEANEGSGTLHQGWEALRLGRPLFIMEEIINNKNLTWPKKLMEYGAQVLSMSNLDLLLESLPVPLREIENNVAF